MLRENKQIVHIDLSNNNFDLEEREIKATVNSTYKKQSADFAKFAKFANLQTNDTVQNNLQNKTIVLEEEDYLKSTPIIPQSVYDNLPSILFDSCQVFTEPRARDTFLTGALAILSGCLPNVSGLYKDRCKAKFSKKQVKISRKYLFVR